MVKKIVYPFFTLLWMLIIYTLSAKTATESGGDSNFIVEMILNMITSSPSQNILDISDTIFRKLCHFGEYGVLAVLVYVSLRSYGITRKNSFITIVFCALYAVSDEIHQYFVPGRACRMFDVCIDTLGASTAVLLLNLKRKSKSE